MSNIRKLRKIKLINVALTGIPMNEGALVTGTFVKSLRHAAEGKDECVQKTVFAIGKINMLFFKITEEISEKPLSIFI